jgi:hypothetical protein
MQHKLLLGSTALVSAGLLMSGAAQAQEARVGGIEVVLGGFTEFGAAAGTRNTITNGGSGSTIGGDRGYTFYMDNELIVRANGATESGILYGSKVELEVGSGGIGNSQTTAIDEVGLYFSGNFGRVELGREDGAEDVMYVGGEDAQAGTGGIDGDQPNIVGPQFADTGDSAKVTYFTPRLAGFQIGASFAPDVEDNGGEDRFQGGGNEAENSIGGGVNWVGALGALDLTLSAVALWADCESNCTSTVNNVQSGFSDDELSWAGGALLGFGGFTLGAGYNRNDTFPHNGQRDIVNVGLKYGFGAANVSVGWTWNQFDDSDLDDSNLIAVSGDIGLLPGVTLKGDVSYNDHDPGSFEGGSIDGENTDDDTWAGVVTVQLDY